MHDPRSYKRLQHQYLVEKELAYKLRTAPQVERRGLYTSLYEEFFKRVPDHPSLHEERTHTAEKLQYRLALLQPYLTSETIFLEIGAGDCCLSFEVARKVKKVYAVDVSPTVTKVIREKK